MRHRFFAVPFLTLILLALLISACSPAATPSPTAAPTSAPPTNTPAPTPITLTDGLGREVTLVEPPARIVTLAPSNTEILFAIGAGDRLVGRDDFSDFPEEVVEIESIGSLFPSVNTEVIVALDPDLVLAAGLTNPDDVQALADLGLTVFATRTDVTLDDVYADILDVGQLTGQTAEAEALVADMQTRVAAITEQTSGLEETPLVFYEIDGTDPARPWTAGPGTFIDALIGMAGGINIGRTATDQYFQISLEQLVEQDPELIILGSATHGGETPESVAARAGWENVTAVTNGQVYPFNDDLISRPGPRLVLGLEALAELIHPELFE